MNKDSMKNDDLCALKDIVRHRRHDRVALIEMHDDDQTFEVIGTAWWAKYSSVNTPEKMLACIYHLSKKAWITKEHIRELLSKFSSRFNFAIDMFNAMD